MDASLHRIFKFIIVVLVNCYMALVLLLPFFNLYFTLPLQYLHIALAIIFLYFHHKHTASSKKFRLVFPLLFLAASIGTAIYFSLTWKIDSLLTNQQYFAQTIGSGHHGITCFQKQKPFFFYVGKSSCKKSNHYKDALLLSDNVFIISRLNHTFLNITFMDEGINIQTADSILARMGLIHGTNRLDFAREQITELTFQREWFDRMEYFTITKNRITYTLHEDSEESLSFSLSDTEYEVLLNHLEELILADTEDSGKAYPIYSISSHKESSGLSEKGRTEIAYLDPESGAAFFNQLKESCLTK